MPKHSFRRKGELTRGLQLSRICCISLFKPIRVAGFLGKYMDEMRTRDRLPCTFLVGLFSPASRSQTGRIDRITEPGVRTDIRSIFEATEKNSELEKPRTDPIRTPVALKRASVKLDLNCLYRPHERPPAHIRVLSAAYNWPWGRPDGGPFNH